jgi:hypothetical protein
LFENGQPHDKAPMPSRFNALARAVAILLMVWLALSLLVNLPSDSAAFLGPLHWALALEVGAILAMLALGRAWAGYVPRIALHVLSGSVILLFVIRAADLTAQTMVGRPLNLFLDLALVPAAAHVAAVMLGPAYVIPAAGGALMIAALHLVLVHLFAYLVRGFRQVAMRQAFAGISGIVLALTAVQGLAPADIIAWRPVSGAASLIVVEQAGRLSSTLARRAAFRADLANDPTLQINDAALFSSLSGTDVMVIFIESYGVSALDNERYSATVRPRLWAFGERLAKAGLSVSSGRLLAATAGGQSWLNHATLSAGRWIDDQTLYALFLTELPRTLVHDFRRAGWRTAQVMPAITLPWPEGHKLGYDATYVAADMNYRGPNFYWGVVPDQFALDFFARRELEVPDRPPIFAMLALISSHAPWLPVPDVVGWEELGDGTIYARWADSAPEPREVWRNTEAVRDQYALSIGHSIDAVAAFLADRIPADALVLVLGDHQPAPVIAGPGASRAVPVHVVAHDPGLLRPFDRLGFVPGVLPPPPPAGDGRLVRIDALRAFLLAAFSAGTDQGKRGGEVRSPRQVGVGAMPR